MSESTFTVLGVYKPHIPEEIYQQQWQVSGSDEDTREHFDGLVLIEAILDDPGGTFKPEHVGQQYQNSLQCMYDEAVLSPDGESLIRRDIQCLKATGPLRIAFYLHFYDPRRPIEWSQGKAECPPIEPIPDRLKRLVPYSPTD